MPPTRLASLCLRLTAIGVVLMLNGCGPRAVGFDDPTPDGRLRAIQAAAREEDPNPRTMRELVRSLNADDPLERLLAIRALEELTGLTHDYKHYETLTSRQAAVNRWLDWLGEEGLANGPMVAWDVIPQPEDQSSEEEPSPP